MEAAKQIGDAVTRARKALSAGCDMVLMCNAPQSALEVADYLEIIGHPESGTYQAARNTVS